MRKNREAAQRRPFPTGAVVGGGLCLALAAALVLAPRDPDSGGRGGAATASTASSASSASATALASGGAAGQTGVPPAGAEGGAGSEGRGSEPRSAPGAPTSEGASVGPPPRGEPTPDDAPPAPPPPPEDEGPATVPPAVGRFPPFDAAFPEVAANAPAPKVLEWAVVKTVVDGDTLTTEEGDKVRLIGINTPEKNEDLYDDAKGYLTALLRGKKIGLETDVEKLDQYQRRLCYVFLDGRFVNGDLVRRGYAHVYRWEPNLKHLKALRYLQQQALGEKLGLWSLPAPEPSPEYVGRSDDHAFHRLSCPRTRLFPAKLRVSFPSREAAFDDGRRACSSCKP